MKVRKQITFGNCQVGDIVEDKFEGKSKVLAKCGLLVFLSRRDDFSCSTSVCYTEEELERFNLKFVQPNEVR